jgi:hypothetical protein
VAEEEEELSLLPVLSVGVRGSSRDKEPADKQRLAVRTLVSSTRGRRLPLLPVMEQRRRERVVLRRLSTPLRRSVELELELAERVREGWIRCRRWRS